MQALEAIRASLPSEARDIKLNIQHVILTPGALTDAQRWGTALACAIATRNATLHQAVKKDAAAVVSDDVLMDARAAATIMGMSNVYYHFRHMIGKDAYSKRPARLRMTYIARPKTSKEDFELFALAVSAINGCELCVQAHEKVVLEKGLTEDHVHDAVRIAATLQATAIALELGDA